MTSLLHALSPVQIGLAPGYIAGRSAGRIFRRSSAGRDRLAVLGAVLEADGEAYGFGVAKATGIGAGPVTQLLWELERQEAIESFEEADPGNRPPRRMYRVKRPW